jgi:hypothetical protein
LLFGNTTSSLRFVVLADHMRSIHFWTFDKDGGHPPDPDGPKKKISNASRRRKHGGAQAGSLIKFLESKQPADMSDIRSDIAEEGDSNAEEEGGSDAEEEDDSNAEEEDWLGSTAFDADEPANSASASSSSRKRERALRGLLWN